MGSVPPLLAFLLMTFSGWVRRRQLMLRDTHATAFRIAEFGLLDAK
jgi:hypothetical protein